MPSPLHRDAPLQIPMFIERVARRFVVAILLAAAVAACGRRDASPPDEADDFVPPGVASEALSARDCPWGLGLCPWPGLKSTAAGKGFRVGIWSEVSGKTVTWGRGEVLTKFIMQGSAFPKAVTFSAYAAPAQAGILRVEVLSDAPTVSARRVLARGRTMVRNVPTAGYAEFTVALHTVAPLTRLADAEAYWLSVWVEGSKGPAGFWLDEATSTAPGVVTQACAKKGPSVSADCKSFVAEATRQLAFIPVFEAAASPSCEDRLRNGDEPSRDCGVVCNRGCGLRSRCYEDRDCSSSGVCRPAGVGPGQSDATCSPSLGDSQQVCACTVKSELGQPCQSDGDCNASVCQGYSGAASVSPICVPKTCRDGKLSPGELDVDCGGPCAALCKLGQSCKVRGDCDRGLLCGGDTALTCVVPRSEGATCSRDWQCTTGACVARKCRPLGAAGAACDTKNDCDSRVCRNLSCAAPTYADRVRNGAETDTDCGGTGPGRKACIGGARCVVTSDCDLTKGLACGTDGLCGLPLAAPCTKNDACLSRLCGKASTALTDTRQVCLTAYPAGDARHCANGLTDADETDLNCGGSVCPGCAATRKCVGNGDCASDVCSLTGSCAAPACTDGVRNGTETAVDCGGACAKCAAGVPATRASDCASG
ncbi:MAG: hypothetical protein RL199_585, partial [Pseudomonadota bacterium]